MGFMDTAKCGTDAFSEFVSGKQSGWLDHAPFPMHPVRFNRVQPRAFNGQSATDASHATVPLHPLVMVLNPRPHLMADMPRGVVPNQQPRRFAQRRQPRADPRQERVVTLLTGRPSTNRIQTCVSLGSNTP